MFGMFDLFNFNNFKIDFNAPSMYEIGRYFLQHKFVVKRCKHKRSRKR